MNIIMGRKAHLRNSVTGSNYLFGKGTRILTVISMLFTFLHYANCSIQSEVSLVNSIKIKNFPAKCIK